MKILFFIESLRSGGKERRLVELVKGLSKNPKMEMEIVLTKDDVHYKEILNIGVKIHYTIRKGLKKDPRIFYKFYKVAKNFQPDIIHVWGNLVAIYAIPAKVLLKTPMINNQISDAPSYVSQSILSHKLSFPFSNKIIANSYAGLKAYGAPEEKSGVIYNGFDFNRISGLEAVEKIRQRFNIGTKNIVGMVASFSDKKDYRSYVMAANKVLKSIKNVTFLCIGSGNDEVYKSMVSPENKDKILFLGKQGEVENIMNACSIGVLATYTEGISNALLEFSALGIPTITTYGGGNVELVENGRSGFLVNQKSPDELAEKIEILLNDELKRKEFGANAKERIATKFSIKNMIDSFTTLYTELVSS